MKVHYNQRDPKEWHRFVSLLKQAVVEDKIDELLSMLLTVDECHSLGLRVQIVKALLEQEMSQREIQQSLNTSIATVTRGSNMLKTSDPQMLEWVNKQLNEKV
ncbi:trp operon repressor [Phocoenobacter skyensis]|uniref:Trp operon repressor homolog n=1 Tax=Phocoenobacter skyensis TaxID=97481 RepID=A0A1H7U5Y4_9PAST|nr:trp operon repressor [Pasteurella skyensis]MDP8078756.1 trp operon repressor [Pasteurella skyensis]MDP8084751.1 trp operon repressor [Pasteurella skyensis]MDP8170179.1 trp operon repressor [Pasteurella skyensis]MDP8174434.1 trp operon repressor [Pasteurella skyensis]MDP8184103.1 trp operon repressor [Pasteurella skyensis]